ncbi:3'-5' exonuclease, partial [Fusobacterium varium]|uniref:3'-5' exonuclease n=1 Tax=Fusobacterium varium TaxID=856 RepID=UPI003F0BB449
INGEVKEEFNIRCKPHANADISEKALEVTGMTLDIINSYQEPKEAMEEMENIFGKYCDKFNKNDKFVLIGQNIKFDFQKLYEFYSRLGNKYLGSWINFKLLFDTLAVIQALQLVDKLPILENNKLITWCNFFGIKLENAHDALADIRATRELAKVLINILEG